MQRVSHADVKVDGETVGSIGKGFLVLVGVGQKIRHQRNRRQIPEENAGASDL